jgi:hypothetical protein
MKNFIVVLLFVCAGVLFAQTGYVHTTNTVTCEMVDNGIIGENTTGTYSGLTYLGGSNVIYSGGIVVTRVSWGGGYIEVAGMCGSYDLNDFVNVEPFTDFNYFDPTFDQIGMYTFTGLQTVSGNFNVKTFSRNDQSVIYIRLKGFPLVPADPYYFYAGIIIDFDIGDYANNSGGYDPERNLIYMFDASPSPSDTNYYGVVLLNVEPNSLHGKLIQNYNATNEEIANYCINTDFSIQPDTADHRLHISMPGIYYPDSIGPSDFAIVCGTSLEDLLNTVDNVVIPYGSFLPVELTLFTVEAQNQRVILKWTTATELNNNGFEIQRKAVKSEFVTIGFVRGEGTTSNQNEYTYIDKGLVDGKYFYRLKQIDYNGSFEYSDVIEVDVRTLDEFALEQNYPNPFNPTTTIGYVLKEKSNAKLTLLNVIGEEIAVLVNEEQDKGFHKVEFSAKGGYASGVYLYRLQAGSYVETKKMILIK